MPAELSRGPVHAADGSGELGGAQRPATLRKRQGAGLERIGVRRSVELPLPAVEVVGEVAGDHRDHVPAQLPVIETEPHRVDVMAEHLELARHGFGRRNACGIYRNAVWRLGDEPDPQRRWILATASRKLPSIGGQA